MRDQQWDRAVQTSRAAEQEEVCREQWVSAPYLYNIIEAALTLTRPHPTAQFTARVSHTLSKYLRTLRAKAKVLRSQRTTRIHWSALLIVRSRGQRRKGQSRLSCARAEERPGRMRHGRWGRAHGWASVPPTASQTIAASSVDAAWGSGHHHEAHMRGTGSVPPYAPPAAMRYCGFNVYII